MLSRTKRWSLLAFTVSASMLSACQDKPSASRFKNDSAAQTVRATSFVADTDDFGDPLPTDGRFAERVVSLNPAATEAIFAIGASSHLVGRSRWDEFPAEAKAVMPVGDGIRPNVEMVLGQRPTLVVLYATADNRAAATAFRAAGVRTLTLRVDRIAQFVSLVTRLGIALNATTQAKIVADSVQRTLDRVREVTRGLTPVRVVWPVSLSPVMVVGSGSYLDELLQIAGANNVFHDVAAPSPMVSIEEIVKRDPSVVVTSAKTSAALRASDGWRAVRAVAENRIALDDPALTGRPSVVLGMAAVSLARALHPELAARLP